MNGLDIAQLITTGWCLALGVVAVSEKAPAWASISFSCAAFNLVLFFN